MKKFLLSFLTLMVAATLFAAPRTVEEAAVIAADFTNSQPQLIRMHKAPRKASNMRLAHKALQNNSEEAAFYVFNQEDENGFVIVSADDRTADEVLGYSEKGSFDAAKINPNFKWWLNRYAEEITALQTIDDSEFTDDPADRKAIQVATISNLLVNPSGKEITWYQETPYNNLCPMDNYDNTRCLTGCVATAASQIMYKWCWPKQGTGKKTYTWNNPNKSSQSVTMTADYANTTYAWDEMLPAYEGKSYTEAQANAVATLMWHAGIACNMGYGGNKAGGSGAWTDDMGYGLVTYFGYNVEKFISMYSKSNYQSAKGTIANIPYEFGVSRDKFTEYFNADLEAGRPILMGGEGNDGGHEFVCCGRDANNKFYINWGWEGSDNGYFAISSLRPGSDNFSSNLDALIGLEPKEAGHAVVTNGTGCIITPSANFAANNEAFSATITPTDATYDFTSLTVKLGNTTLTKYTHYVLSNDNKTLKIKDTAITGEYSDDLTITAVWTKNRYKYDMLGENCTEELSGMLEKGAALQLTIAPNSGYTLSNAACWDVTMGGNALTYGTGFTYEGTTFSIASVTGDVEIYAYGGKEVTWMANGALFATTLTSGDKYVLPAGAAEIECYDRVFVGWCATENYSHETTAPAFIKEGDAATQGNIFYAVFAEAHEVSGVAHLEKASSIAVGYQVVLVCESKNMELSSFSSSNTIYGIGTDYYDTPSENYLFNIVAGSVADSYAFVRDGNYWNWTSGNSLSTAPSLSENTSWSVSFNSGNADIVNKADESRKIRWNASSPRFACYTSGQTDVQLYKKVGGSSTGYSNYSTTCTPPCKGELTSITLNTDAVKKEFKEGEAFTYDGLVVTANIEGCDSKAVTPTSVSTPDMNTIGEQTITVNYNDKSATYTINVTALPTYTIRFYNNGSLVGAEQNVKQGQTAAVPQDIEVCEGYTFAGWATELIKEETEVAPAFVTDFTATQNQDYYAVFSKTEEGGGSSEPAETTYTFTSKSWEDATNSWTSTKDGNQLTNGQGIQVTTGFSGAGATTKSSVENVSKVVVHYCTNASRGAGSIDITIGSTKVSNDVTKIGGTSLRELEFDFDNASGNMAIEVTCTDNSIYVNAITVITGSSAAHSTYSTTCAAPCEGELTSITLDTEDVKKTFAESEAFTFDGLVVTANIEGCDSKIVTPTSVSTPDMNTIGEQTVTVTYNDQSATYTINVTTLPTYTIRFYNNGSLVGAAQNVKQGQAAEKPADQEACEGYTFTGWATAAIEEATTAAPTFVTDFTATQDQDYYAVFSNSEESEGASGASVIFKDVDTDETKDASKTIKEDLVKEDTGIKSYSGSKVYAGVYGAKLGSSKANGTITIILSAPVTTNVISVDAKKYVSDTGKLSITVNKDNAFGSAQSPAEEGGVLTFTGSETAIDSITIATSSKRAYIRSIIIGSGSSSTTYYTTAPDCAAPCEGELTSITLNTDDVKKTFNVDEEFSYDGLIVTANYSNDCESKVVNRISVSTPDMSTAGKKTVTVRYTEGNNTQEASYEINVVAAVSYTIGFYYNGELIGQQQTVAAGQAAVVPTNIVVCNGYEFAGWSTETLATDNTVAPTYVTDFTATQDQNYYAVFTQTIEGEDQNLRIDTVTREITGVANGSTDYTAWMDVSLSSSAVYAGMNAGNYDAIQIRSGNNNSGIVTTASGGKLVKISVEWNSNTANGRTLNIFGKNEAYSAATDLYNAETQGTLIGTIVCGTSNDLVIEGEYAYVGVRANSGAIYLDAIQFKWYDGEGDTSGSTGITYYTTAPDCGPVEPCVLSGITLNTENVKKEFKAGEEFSYEGLLATATYSNCINKDITLAVQVEAPDMSVAGTKTVTVRYSEEGIAKEATYDITVTELASYSIGFYNNNALIGEKQTVVEGQAAEVPADPEACEGYMFAGWFTEALAVDNTVAPVYVTDFTATQDQNYYAVFSKREEGEGSETGAAVEDVLNRETTGVTNTTYTDWEDITVTSSAVYAGNSAGGNNAIQLRSNYNNSGIVTTASGGILSKVTVVWNSSTSSERKLDIYGKNEAYSAATDLYDNVKQGTKLGSITYGTDTELVIESEYAYVGVRSNSGAMYLDSIIFSWGGATGTTYYTTAPDCSAPVECELTGIALNTDDVQKDFKVGDTFSYEGLVVTAEYSNCDSKPVQATSVSEPDMTETGTKTVTVSYTLNDVTKEATYEITVRALYSYSIGFYSMGELIGEKQTVAEGQAAEVPQEIDACEGYTFAGWVTAPVEEETDAAPAFVTDFTATQDQDYYAVFSKEEESSAPNTDYKKINTKDELASGNYLVVGFKTNYYAMLNELISTYINQQQVTPNNDVISNPDASIIWNITVNDDTLSFYNAAVSKYVHIYQNGTRYYAGLTENETDNIHFTYSVNESGSWDFINTVLQEQHLEYYGDKSDFTAYKNAGDPIYLYKQGTGNTVYYTTAPNCGSVAPCELSDITLDTENVKKEFKTGEEFTSQGLVVMAQYNNCHEKNVTLAVSVEAPDMSKAGTKTVTVRYSEEDIVKEATYDITVTEPATYSIGFYSMGELIGEIQTVTEGQAAVAPQEIDACEGYTFAGWFTEDLAVDNTKAPKYITDFTTTQDQNYYAVFSKREEGEGSGKPVEDILTREITGVSGTSYTTWEGKTITSSAVYAGNSAGGNEAIQLRSNTNSGIISTISGGQISKVNVIWNSNTTTASTRALDIYGKNEAYSGTADLYDSQKQGTKIGSIVFGTSTEAIIEGEYAYIGVRSNNGAMYLDSIIFTWGGATGTTYYTTAPDCSAPVECELTGITLDTENVQKEFKTGREFKYDGLIVMANYSNCQDRNVSASAVVEAPDMSTAGTKTVTVTYTKDETTVSNTYEISVVDPAVYTVRFLDNGAEISTQQVTEGEKAEKPEDPQSKEGYTFVGWWPESLSIDNTTAHAWVNDFTINADQDFYAIYAHKEGGSTPVDDALVLETTGITGTTYAEWTASVGSTTYKGNSAGGNSSIQLRSTSQSGIITTVSCGKALKVIVEWNEEAMASITNERELSIYGKNTAYEVTGDLYDNSKKGDLLGSIKYEKPASSPAKAVKAEVTNEFTISGDYEYIGLRSKSGAMYLNKITITWSSESTTYTSNTGGATKIEQTESGQLKTEKILRDGQIVIIRGEAVYSITGARIN